MGTLLRHRTPYEWHLLRCRAGDVLTEAGQWLIAAVVALLAIAAAVGIGTGALLLLLTLIGGPS